MKVETAPKPIHLKDYRPPHYWVSTVDLHFDLHDEFARVTAKTAFFRNRDAMAAPLTLHGEQLKLERIAVNGRALDASEYVVTDDQLTLVSPPESFVLETVVVIEPQKNFSCEGLYKSDGMFCTQCEAESFRRITYFLDRPDVMATYTVTIEADEAKSPILLANGNLVSQRSLGGGRHQAVWSDLHKKPCYLFALVAGDLGVLEDAFITRSGREVKLRIFARRGLEDRCRHAMDSLKRAMKWDEDTYGLEYDLDIFMIVVVGEFNMGAMENKGLNIFNANYILANPQTATDKDYDSILSVVGHEYFHNWTGNRVTCRDWFQLSLKEGLTVFRDQRFSGEMGSEAVKRIEEIIRLRTHQFAEDAGPMAHPIRPQSYISIDNFYTMTIYEKGAEVIRMIETIVGRNGFRKGMDKYFELFDGQAVTTEDFVRAMEIANGVDLTQFKNWYDQAGTPVIKVTANHDPAKAIYTVTIEQSCAPSPGQPEKRPYHIPVAVGLLGPGGTDLPLQLELETAARPFVTGPLAAPTQPMAEPLSKSTTGCHNGDHTLVLHVREPRQSFTFTNVKERPVLSLLRNFSAPVRVEFDHSDDELAFIMANDSDTFSRWEAAQTLTVRTTQELVTDFQSGRPLRVPENLAAAFGPLLNDESLDPAFVSFILALPAEQYIGQFFKTIDIDAIHEAREHLIREISRAHRTRLLAIYESLAKKRTDGTTGARAAGERALRSRVLEYIAMSDEPAHLELAVRQRREAKNMTDELGALHALNRTLSPLRRQALDEFHAKWKDEPLVINKWLSTQAVAPVKNALAEVKRLAEDPVFDRNNPNKIFSLYIAFGMFNLVRFHDPSGEAYRFIADQIMDIDSRNPQVAARLMSTFNQWRRFDPKRQELMKGELSRILAKPGLSSNVFEVASKTLNVC